MDGKEACRQIRALPGGDQVRIVGLTASILHEERNELLKAGMDDIICKPYTHDEIFSCMEKLLNLSYLYEDVPTENETRADISRLAELPLSLQEALRAALYTFDGASVDSVVADISNTDAVLGSALAGYLAQSNHSAILQALEGG
jgi:CheY-like chemotaxis protein